jgi:CBS domain containing-hemolysin-like protein
MIEATLPTALSVLAVLALILLNAAWVAAEFAIVRVRRTRLAELAGQGTESAKHAIVVVDRMSDYLALTQIGVTVSSLAVGWLAEDAFVRVLGFSAAAAFVIASALLIVLGELVPKLLAVRRAEHYLLVLSRPLRVAHLLFRPVLRVLERVSTWIIRWLGHGGAENRPLTEDELKLVLADSHRGGVVSDREAEIIVRAFEFADKQSEEIMVPAGKVAYLSLERSLRENLDEMRRHMHTRFPLCRRGLDTVIGTVSMKDAWPLLEAEPSNAAFERVCRPPIVVSVDLSQEGVLKALQKGRGHMAIVRDDARRRTLGIVTLEDVLHSLIGDVREAKLR